MIVSVTELFFINYFNMLIYLPKNILTYLDHHFVTNKTNSNIWVILSSCRSFKSSSAPSMSLPIFKNHLSNQYQRNLNRKPLICITWRIGAGNNSCGVSCQLSIKICFQLLKCLHMQGWSFQRQSMEKINGKINGKNQQKKSKTKGKFNGKINGKGNLSGAAFEDLNPRKLNTNLN